MAMALLADASVETHHSMLTRSPSFLTADYSSDSFRLPQGSPGGGSSVEALAVEFHESEKLLEARRAYCRQLNESIRLLQQGIQSMTADRTKTTSSNQVRGPCRLFLFLSVRVRDGECGEAPSRG